MFCSNCGQQLPDGAQFCNNCGARLGGAAQSSQASSYSQPPQPAPQPVYQAPQPPAGGGSYIKTDRSLLTYVVLTILTCGIYGYWFVYSVARDLNVMCADDGEHTGGLAAYIILSIVTCGIYNLWWLYKIGNRLQRNAPRYGLQFQENGTSVLMWYIFGSLLCFIGSFIALNIVIKNTNRLASAYNASLSGGARTGYGY